MSGRVRLSEKVLLDRGVHSPEVPIAQPLRGSRKHFLKFRRVLVNHYPAFAVFSKSNMRNVFRICISIVSQWAAKDEFTRSKAVVGSELEYC